jgi:hypothetical protein
LLLVRHRLVQEERQYPEILVSASTGLLLVAMALARVLHQQSTHGNRCRQPCFGHYHCVQYGGGISISKWFECSSAIPWYQGSSAHLCCGARGCFARFTAQVLPSLTASYSTDTVERLAGLCLLVHLLFCDLASRTPMDDRQRVHGLDLQPCLASRPKRTRPVLWLGIRVVVHCFKVVLRRSMPCFSP